MNDANRSETQHTPADSAAALAKYLREACDASQAAGHNAIMVNVPKPFALPLAEARQIADRLAPAEHKINADMLEALRLVRDLMDGPKPPAGIYAEGTGESVRTTICAAILKAEGGQK